MSEKSDSSHILEELVKLNINFDNLYKDIKELKDQVRDKFSVHDKLFYGNNGDAGIIRQVDRLNQSESRRGLWTKAAISASLGAFVTALATFLHINIGR